MDREEMAWVFDNLTDQPFGVLPLENLNPTGGPTSIEKYEQLGSYNWVMNESKDGTSTLVVPGAPRRFKDWNGGRLNKDEGLLLYDANHKKSPKAPIDPVFLTLKHLGDIERKPIDFQQFDLITDAINLVKLFAFTNGPGGGMFRMDLERIGRSIIAHRLEPSDIVPIDYTTYDLGFRDKCTHPVPHKLMAGRYEQMAKYEFGRLRILVRFEPECADFGKSEQAAIPGDPDPNLEIQTFALNEDIQYVEHGKRPKRYELMTTISYPQNQGFPEFTYSKLFFTGIDKLLIGNWQGPGDFTAPKSYSMTDVMKQIKTQQIQTQLSKTYDCLLKLVNLMRKNPEALKIALVWSGNDYLEMYEKGLARQSPISESVRMYLKSQVTEQMPGDIDELDNVDYD